MKPQAPLTFYPRLQSCYSHTRWLTVDVAKNHISVIGMFEDNNNIDQGLAATPLRVNEAIVEKAIKAAHDWSCTMDKSRTLNTVIARFEPSRVLVHTHHKHPMDEMKCEGLTCSMSYSRLPLSYSLWLKKPIAKSQDSCKAVMNKHASHWSSSAELECDGF